MRSGEHSRVSFCHLESRSSDALAGAKTTHRFAISITRRAVQVNTSIGNTAKKLHRMQRCTSPESYQTGAPTVEVVTRDGSRAGKVGGPCKIRTYDLRIKSQLLYRLSYRPPKKAGIVPAFHSRVQRPPAR